MPATRATSSGSPFGMRCCLIASTVAADIRTKPLATAVLVVTGLSPTSTIRARPSLSMCVNSIRLLETTLCIHHVSIQREDFDRLAFRDFVRIFAHYYQSVRFHKSDEVGRAAPFQ